MNYDNQANANIRSQASFMGTLQAASRQYPDQTQDLYGNLGACLSRKPLRERLKDRTAAQSTTATEATKKEAAMLELAALLKENPHVARILELIEELGL